MLHNFFKAYDVHMLCVTITRGPVMSPGAIGTRKGVSTVKTLRALRPVSVVMFHNSMLQVYSTSQYYLCTLII